MLHGRNGPKTPTTTPTFLAKFYLCGWYWEAVTRGKLRSCPPYMNYGVIIAKANLTFIYNLGTTYHITYNIHTFMER